MARRSRVQGVNKLRRTLRRIDPEATEAVRVAIAEGVQAIELDAVQLVPKDTGDLARSIQHKVSRDGLTAIVGPGANAAEIVRRKAGSAFNVRGVKLSNKNKELMFQFFKGYWIERGTKGNPKKNIPPQPPRPFMKPAYDMNKQWILGRVKKGIANALAKAAGDGNG